MVEDGGGDARFAEDRLVLLAGEAVLADVLELLTQRRRSEGPAGKAGQRLGQEVGDGVIEQTGVLESRRIGVGR